MNTEQKHTPGPWSTSSAFGVISNDEVICRVRRIRKGQGEANARLIAAAPDLLAALNDMLSILDDAGTEDEETWQPGQRWIFTEDKISAKNRITSARAARAKAEGKA